jgi:inner membrane protein
MDPLTHALLGATAAHVAFGRRLGGKAALVGAVGALLPDADVLIRSSADPLLAIEHHRGFTHSFAFIPVGGMVAGLPWLLQRSRRALALPVLGAAMLGYATHGPLDAATTYGTQLFWPFSSARVGLNWIAIIDPLFTLVLAAGLILALRWRSPRIGLPPLLLCMLYLGIGFLQRERALAAQERIAEARAHPRIRGAVFPTIGNHLVWRSLYEANDSLHSDRVRVGWVGEVVWVPGTTVPVLREADLPPEKSTEPRLLRDFRRFAWFSDGWVARAPADPRLIGDVRYSLVTGGFEPVWGVRLQLGTGAYTEWVNRSRERQLRLSDLWTEISGADPAYRAVPRLVAGGVTR